MISKNNDINYNPPSLSWNNPPSVFLWDMYFQSIKKSPNKAEIQQIINLPFPEDDY